MNEDRRVSVVQLRAWARPAEKVSSDDQTATLQPERGIVMGRQDEERWFPGDGRVQRVQQRVHPFGGECFGTQGTIGIEHGSNLGSVRAHSSVIVGREIVDENTKMRIPRLRQSGAPNG
ncbi:hypothetical protein [Streptomyces sp. NBC_01518]|uniref:hypothetical protein n=1 Tax=Streptomyces sp. NBC_01518 TaxID=2903891 RepID=UPI00386626EE